MHAFLATRSVDVQCSDEIRKPDFRSCDISLLEEETTTATPGLGEEATDTNLSLSFDKDILCMLHMHY